MSRKGYSKLSDWREIYQLPLEDEPHGLYVWSKNGTMSLMFADSKFPQRTKIVDSINGISPYVIENLTFDGIDFYQNGKYIFCIRGWGHLTGGLSISEQEAIEIQNKFRDYIFEHLT